ncbi:MAG: LamG-like jellyroll fold domain-containing protein [Phycisphaerales bacterium JB063]
MRTRRWIAAILWTTLMFLGQPVLAQDAPQDGEAGPHDHDPRERFITNRVSGVELPLTDEADAFFFVVFGDRTGGPADGVRVLAQAVEDTNLLKPDLVMTVGDLVQGYNTTDQWLVQMREYKGIMDGLDCPWFPVAGNHDIYWRGPGKPEGEHEANYEEHFGPLWYAFEHKDCWFVVLHSDEGGADGRFEFGRPESQRMSDEQFDWLSQTLESAAEAPHIFVFLHHPRWNGGGYGDDWQRVHTLLAEAGNVSAVFAGHVHRMSHDGVRDGIEYVTLATTGGHQPGLVPGAGYLHHFDVVTVRGDEIGLAAIPVGGVMDVRAITQEVQRETVALSRTAPTFEVVPTLSSEGVESGELTLIYRNPSSRPIDLTVYLDTADSRWRVGPDHLHGRVEAGESQRFTFEADRFPAGLDDAYRGLEVVTQVDYLGEGLRVPIPERRDVVPVQLRVPAMERPDGEQVLALGGDDALVVPSSAFDLPDGPLTVECWVNPTRLGSRVGLVCKTENSEYGLMVEGGRLSFLLFLGERYQSASCALDLLKPGQWQHVAGVFDGEQMRLYIDGALVGSSPASGARRTNLLPLVIGGDVNNQGDAVSMLDGEIDAIRISNTARYAGVQFDPVRRHEPDGQTVLLHQMDGAFVGHYVDASASEAHATAVGQPTLVGAAAE